MGGGPGQAEEFKFVPLEVANRLDGAGQGASSMAETTADLGYLGGSGP